MILVQSLEQESAAGKEDHGEQATKEQKQDDGKVKKDDEFKVELTMQAEEEDIETIKIDQEEAKPMQASKTETDSKKTIEKIKTDDDQEVKSEETEGEEKDKPTLIVVEKAPVQDPSPIPSPGSKIEKETSVARKPEAIEAIDDGKEDDKPSQVRKPDKLLPKESSKEKDRDPSSQELNKSKSSQHHPDPVSSPSHPLKPLPNIDDGITETKSEPRLPLLPPIGSKKITTLQSSSGALKSHSATGIIANVAATKEQSKGPTEKRKDGESAPSSDQASTKKKKKSTDSLRSTSGSSISKSKKSSSSNSTVSLGQKSKSRESLKSGPQNRLSTITPKSSDNLVNGAAKKLSISKESLKAASQVYSSVPAPKSGGELIKKGDSGKSQSSKSKEAVKAEKERKSSDQKPPDKAEVVAGDDSKAKEEMPESSSSEKEKDGDGLNQDDTAKKEPDSDTKQTALPSTSVEKVMIPPAKKEKTNEVAVTVSEPEEKTNTNDQTSANASPKEEADKSIKADKQDCGDTGENSGAKEVKNEAPSGSAEVEPTVMTDGVTEKDQQVKSQDKNEDSPPPKPTKETKMEGEKESNKAPISSTPAKVEAPASSAPTNVEVKIDDIKTKDDTSDTTEPQEQAKEVVSKSPQPKDIKELPAGPGSETTSQISSSEFACKLEIDKKTGQSEQSIVEAVEKSTEPTVTTRDVTTPV